MLEDALAEQMWNLAATVVAHRARSLMENSSSYPGRLGQLLHTSDSVRDSAFDELKVDIAAFRAATFQSGWRVKRLVERSPWQTPCMKVVMNLVDRSPQSPSPLLLAYVSEIASGWQQSKIVEDTNRVCRERETRDQNSKTMRRTRRWAEPRTRELVKAWGRTEVCDVNTGNAPAKVPDAFYAATDSTKKPELKLLKGITSTATWPTFRPDTVSSLVAETEVARYLHSCNSWALTTELWKVMLFPSRHVVRNLTTDEYFLVLETHSSVAALLWPLRPDGDYFDVQVSLSRLRWTVVTAIDTWQVCDARACSPLHQFLAEKVCRGCIRLKRQDEPRGLLEWHASRGFAGLPETVLSKVKAELGVQLAEENLKDAHGCKQEALAAALVCHVAPGWGEADVAAALRRRLLLERAEDVDSLEVALDEEALQSTLVTDDFRVGKQWLGEARKSVKSQQELAEKVPGVVAAVAKKMKKVRSELIASNPHAGSRVPKPFGCVIADSGLKAEKKVIVKKHWKPAMLRGDLSIVRELLPMCATHCIDAVNGRILLCNRLTMERKSVSWTLRGHKAAMAQALTKAWDWQFDATGERSSFSHIWED